MPRIVLLGVSSAFPRPESDPTSFVIEDDAGHALLVDCGGSPLQRFLAARCDPAKLAAVFVTHTHPDHLSGFPLLIHGLRMLGREVELSVLGHRVALAAARSLMESLGLNEEKGFPLRWREVPAESEAVMAVGPLSMTSFPVMHSRPTLGLKVSVGGREVVYSSDTGPCDRVVDKARGASVLIHEMGALDDEGHPYHTAPMDLAAIARDASPGLLIIVHTPPLDWPARERILAAIRAAHGGRVDFGEALASYVF